MVAERDLLAIAKFLVHKGSRIEIIIINLFATNQNIHNRNVKIWA